MSRATRSPNRPPGLREEGGASWLGAADSDPSPWSGFPTELLEASLNELYLFDADTLRFEHANQGALSNLGYTLAEIRKLTPLDLKPELTPESFQALIGPLLRREKPMQVFETAHRRADGSTYPVEVHLQLLERETERLFLAVIRDITQQKAVENELRLLKSALRASANAIAVKQDSSEHKETEQRLKASEARLARAQEMAHLGDWELDLDTHDLHWSDEVYRIFGLVPGTVTPTNELFFAAMHSAEQQAIRQAVQTAVETGQPYSIDHRIRRPDGSERVVHEHAEMVRDARGRPMKLRGTVQDITERKHAEERLRESEAFYHSLVENVPQNIFRKDLAGRFTFVNSRFCRTIGPAVHDILGRSDADLFPPELAAKYRADDRQVMDSGQPYHTIETHTQPTGESLSVEVIKTPLRDSTGRVIGVQGVFWDVTERQRTEQALARSEEKFARLFQDNPAAMSISTLAEGRFLEVNDQYCALSGYARQELVGRKAVELGLWEEPTDRERLVVELQKMGFVRDQEVRVRARDGDLRYALLSAERLELDESAEPLLMTTCVDITERKRAQAKMGELFEILDQARECIVVRDLEGHILYLNQGALQISGYTLDDVLGKNGATLFYRHHREHHAAMRDLFEKGEWQGEHLLTTKAGQDVTVDGRWTLVRDDAGKPQSVVAISVDLTERKKLEAQFLRAQRMESIGALASGIAHDLNNILTPIVMTAPMLRMDLPREDREQLLATVEASCQRAVEVIKQILGFARGQEGQQILLQPRHLLREMGRIIRETFPPSIRLSETVLKDLWPVTGNATHLHQVLLNLCVNARDAMPGGGTLTLATQNVVLEEQDPDHPAEAAPGNYVRFDVSDTGEGIPDAIREKVFDPFFTTKEPGKGTGLGLTTVLGIVKNHGGFLRLESAPGVGTTFRIFLPAAPGGLVPGEAGQVPESPRGHGELILVVDDEPAIRHTTQRTLRQHGYRTLEASHGEEALAVLQDRDHEVALVVSDLLMPVMGGVLLCQRLQQLRPGLPRIVCTGTALEHTREDTRAALIRAGVKHILAKPHSRDGLLLAVADEIQQSRALRQASLPPLNL